MTFMKNRAIIFDLDGTAINSPIQKLPTKRLVNILEKLQNKYFLSVATGRCWTFAEEVVKSLKIKDLSVLSGGTQICNTRSGEVVWQKNISQDALRKVVEIFSENAKQKLIFNDYTEDDYFNGGVYPKDFKLNIKVNWLSQSFVPDKIATNLHDRLDLVKGITCVMVVSQKSGCRDLHIVNKKATKEHAISELLKRLKVTKENTIGIGDGHNDIHLFNSVGYKVAMGNAVEDLKKVADKIIGNVTNDGLAEYFEELNLAK
jgi:Cof subfamily protein (haloacid dehalogenase superfamily)